MNEDIEIPAGHACRNPGRHSYLAGPTLGGKISPIPKGHNSITALDPTVPVTIYPMEKASFIPQTGRI